MPALGDDSDTEDGGPVATYQSYIAEGDILSKQGEFRKSIEAYSKALRLKPGDKNGLVTRSKCFLLLGSPDSALEDADAALAQDTTFFKGIYQKAEALYAKGDFEMALVYFHRGQTLRPEMDDFRLGIQKTREAIDNSIGNPKDYKFTPPSGAKLVVTLPAPKPGQPILTGAAAPVPTVVWVTNKPIPPTGFVPHINTKQAEVAAAKSERRVKQLLGELYEDKEYLSKLTKDKDFSHNPNVKVTRLVGEALSYLDNRAEFWRQQKPVKVKKRDQAQLAHMIEARNLTAIFDKGKEAKLRIEAKEKASAPRKVPVSIRPVTSPRKASVTNALPPPTPSQKVQESEQQQKIVQSTFELIHHAMQRKDYEVALRSARSLLARLTELRGLQNRDKTTADLFHLMGAIYQHLCNPTEALMYYRKEHSIGKEHRDGLIISRALSDMSRILVKSRKYKEAVSAFEEKIPYSSELSIERAWLYHDLGRCYLELKNDDRALDLGLRSASIADDLKDRRWGMNARLLIAQAQAKKNEFGGAAETYEIALRNAKEIHDNQAIKAITKALKDAHILKDPVGLGEPPLRKKSASSLRAGIATSGPGVRAR